MPRSLTSGKWILWKQQNNLSFARDGIYFLNFDRKVNEDAFVEALEKEKRLGKGKKNARDSRLTEYNGKISVKTELVSQKGVCR